MNFKCFIFFLERVEILRKQPACFLNFVIIFGDYFHAYELSSPIVETLLACLIILLNIEATQGIELVTTVVIYLSIFLKLIEG